MLLRSGRTTRATPSWVGDGGVDMNASLWGELQCFVDLSLIYAKLPLAPFFRLRLVCKEWNRLASDRQFLEHKFKPPISNLYFVVARSAGHRLWTSPDSSSWTSSPLPRRRCEVSGLLYEDSDRHRVLDLHTRVFYSLPPLPSGNPMAGGSIVGMTVDTTLIPYGFRIVIGEANGTNVYDSSSGAWTTSTSSHVMSRMRSSLILSTFSSILYQKVLYLLVEDYSWGECFVHTYDLKRHVWGCVVFGLPEVNQWAYGGICVWQDRWFAFGMNANSGLMAWEMITNTQQLRIPWIVFDCMSEDLCKWMMNRFWHKGI